MTLTVVVPTIAGRAKLLSRCLWSIQQQGYHDDVELIVIDGTAGLGDKANHAATIATGTHMTVVDDDDYLDGAYLDEVLHRLDVDYVGFKVLQLIDGAYYGIASTQGDRESSKWTRREFGPCPKGITRTSLWRAAPLGNEYLADRKWRPAVVTHRFVDRCLYIYDWWPATSAYVGEGKQQPDVGNWPVDWSRISYLTLPAQESP